MTALQWIIKEAKILRKKSPKMEWKKAVAQASAIYASKHKGKSPVGKKKVVRKKVGKVTLKKSNRFKGDERYIIMNDGHKHLEGKPFFKQTAKDVASALRKVKAKRKKSAKKVGTVKRKVVRKKTAKKKPTEKAVLKSIKHAVSVQKAHMSGISGHAMHNIDKELKQIKHLESLIRSNEIAKKNTKDSKAKKAMSNSIKKYKELMKEHKIHITQLKKHI